MSPFLLQAWQLDATGNWNGLRETDSAQAPPGLDQQRTTNRANEVTSISRRYGYNWAQPDYDRAGNMRAFPRPHAPSAAAGTATYDAWNRLITTEANGLHTPMSYDPLHRRLVQAPAATTIHYYYSADWQVLEERQGTTPNSAPAERQFVWGLRYIDDLVLRDRSPTNNGTLSERLYALQDANWNVTAVVDVTGDVQERYRYSPYGMPTFLNADFSPKALGGSYAWETLYCGYRWDAASGFYQVRQRYLHPLLGCWVTRDPILASEPLAATYEYANGSPLVFLDPTGEESIELTSIEYCPKISTCKLSESHQMLLPRAPRGVPKPIALARQIQALKLKCTLSGLTYMMCGGRYYCVGACEGGCAVRGNYCVLVCFGKPVCNCQPPSAG